MNDTQSLTKSEVAKEYLDFLRATITTFTWTALCIAVVAIIWRPEMMVHGIPYWVIGAAVSVVAFITTIAAAYSLVISSRAFRQKLGPKASWVVSISVSVFGPAVMWFFGVVVVLVLLLPMLRNFAPVNG